MPRRYLGGSGERLTVWISIAASTVLIFYGYDQGVFGNVLVSDDFLRTMGYPSTADQGTMTSVYNLGCFAGALSTLYSGDKLGRPRTLMLGSSVIAVAAVIQAASYSAGQMYAGRVIAGLGTGMNTATAGVWQSETSKMRSRGKLIIIQMANCITGFAISNWLTLGFSFAPGSVSWRFPLAFQMCESDFSAVDFNHVWLLNLPNSLLGAGLAYVPLPPRLAPPAHPQGSARRSHGGPRRPRGPRRHARLALGPHAVLHYQGCA